MRTCEIDGCPNKHKSLGYCDKHYKNYLRTGNPIPGKEYRPSNLKGIDEAISFYISMADRVDSCLVLDKYLDSWGYPQVKIANKSYLLPRLILSRKIGRELSPQEVTRHTCDNTKCINPMHLTYGNHRDNMADKVARGRCNMPIGTRSPRAKLTDTQVREIRSLYSRGNLSQTRLSEMYGVSQNAISQTVRRLRYQDID